MSSDGEHSIGCQAEDRLRRAEQSIKRLTRVHAMFRQIREQTTRTKNHDQLFAAMCRVVVDQGEFPMCGIARFERANQRLRAAASAGRSDSLAAAVQRLTASLFEALAEPVWQVIRENRVVICEESARERFDPEEGETGVVALALLPLIVSDELVAVMVLGVGEAENAFEGEMHLLIQLAEEVAFGIDYLDKLDRLQYLTYYDAITGLANRHLFLERATEYIQSARANDRRMALCLFDLERFKSVNDSLGRPAGDALLKQVGTWLSRRFGNHHRVARVGVDHFGVLLPALTGEGAAADAVEKELEAFVQQPFRLQDSMFRIAARAGIAVYPDDGADPEILFRHAEAALDEAKNSAVRCVRYRKQMTETVSDRLNLETRLRQALERGEFRLHYQPKVRLCDDRLTGAEALIRWQDPDSGLVSPARFIPILEETGLIHDVGAWALRQAVEDARRWRAAGFPPLRIAVNVSPMQLRHPSFVPTVWRVVASEAMDPIDLELEITESVIMESIQQNIGVLQAIREMGIQIAIDDFGTGFSSLSYLSRLPIDTLKIDRSFVVDMTAGPQGHSLVSTIVSLAHTLKLKVVAEGVETDEQSRLLRLLGCDEMQGHLCSEALPASMFESRFLRVRGDS